MSSWLLSASSPRLLPQFQWANQQITTHHTSPFLVIFVVPQPVKILALGPDHSFLMLLPSESECALRNPRSSALAWSAPSLLPPSLLSSHRPGLAPDLLPPMPAAPHSPCYKHPCSTLRLTRLPLGAPLRRPRSPTRSSKPMTPRPPTGLQPLRLLIPRAMPGLHVRHESNLLPSLFYPPVHPPHLAQSQPWAESPLLVPSLHLSC